MPSTEIKRQSLAEVLIQSASTARHECLESMHAPEMQRQFCLDNVVQTAATTRHSCSA